MARAAAEAKEFAPASLVVAEILATEGPKIKRMRPNARGRGNSYQKLLAHLTITVAEAKSSPKPKKQPKARAKKSTVAEVKPEEKA